MAKFRFKHGERIFEKIRDLFSSETQKTLNQVAQTATEMIVERTDSGKDRSGKKFKPYAQSTIKQKKRKKVLGGGRTVNLQDSGQMMNRVDVVRRARGNKVRIGVIGGFEQKKMQHNIKMGRDPMGVTGKEREILAELAKKRIVRIVKNLQ